MLSTLITALLLMVMVLIITCLLLSAWREHQRHKRLLRTQTQASTQPLSQHITTTLHVQNGMLVGVEKPKLSPAFTLSSSWYTRRRTLVSLSRNKDPPHCKPPNHWVAPRLPLMHQA